MHKQKESDQTVPASGEFTEKQKQAGKIGEARLRSGRTGATNSIVMNRITGRCSE